MCVWVRTMLEGVRAKTLEAIDVITSQMEIFAEFVCNLPDLSYHSVLVQHDFGGNHGYATI